MFDKQELNNIRQLLARTDIKGGESIVVALLLQKIDQLLKGTEEKAE
jgi:hypothetical protein